MSKTKIIATLGPSTNTKDKINALIKAGADIFRINMSHETSKGALDLIRTIRDLNSKISILFDLQGPRIRTGKLKNGQITLKKGDEITITSKQIEGDESKISVDYPSLPEKLKPGQKILIDNGLIDLRVKNISGTEIYTVVHNGGVLGEHKGVNIPGVSVFKKALTEKDKEDIKIAIAGSVDYIALSFVKKPSDVIETKKFISESGGNIPVISKIENTEAIKNIDEIIEISDAIMIARGDMGVELPPEDVPVIQKEIIKKCSRMVKPVIVASQMLESMVSNPKPTRAESSDVANAILDGADAVMLSEETANGQYPDESVKMMDRIAQRIEEANPRRSHIHKKDVVGNVSLAVSHATVHTCEDIQAKAIITFTTSGSTALMISKWRPNVPIIASVTNEKTARRVSLYWGVNPIIIGKCNTTDEMISSVSKTIIEKKLLKKGDLVVITAGVPIGVPGTTNLMKVHKIE